MCPVLYCMYRLAVCLCILRANIDKWINVEREEMPLYVSRPLS